MDNQTDRSLFSKEDRIFMHLAVRLGEKGLGRTEPNPMVGAVAVKDGRIISTGYHRKYGEIHAERMALDQTDAAGATLYVSLEPCSHTGHTPPCTDIIIEKKVSRVVIPMKDPNPKVNGSGIRKLNEAGIRVDTGLLADEAKAFNRHYLKYITTGIPYVTINAGVSADGKLSDKKRNSQWITGGLSRAMSHSFRGEFSAIMAGTHTVVDDDPMLNLREDGWGEKRLVRVIADTRNRLDERMKIFSINGRSPVFLFSAKGYEKKGKKTADHFFVEEGPGGLDLREVLAVLGGRGISSVLVEGGGKLIGSFLASGLADEIVLFVSDKILGGKESVEIYAEGSLLSDPVRLESRSVIELEEGFIIRGLI